MLTAANQGGHQIALAVRIDAERKGLLPVARQHIGLPGSHVSYLNRGAGGRSGPTPRDNLGIVSARAVSQLMSVALRRAWAKDLDTATLYELLKLRVEVFVVEQATPYPELDGRDLLRRDSSFLAGGTRRPTSSAHCG